MHHDIALIATIAVGFVSAAILGYIADRMRLPPLVGYLAAGILIGPFSPGFTANGDIASQLAELGVILLMFGVGLHFSASDLKAVRALAVPGAVLQIVLVTLLGMGLASLFGRSPGTGLVFGLCLSVASTVVLLKALEERNLVNSAAGRVAIGWLIVEDLVMVLVLVLLPLLAEVIGGQVAGHAGDHAVPADATTITVNIIVTLAKVSGFTVLAVVLGPKTVPWMLTQVARTGSRELFTLSVLAIALGIAFGSAMLFGVSFALGAFFAGVIMSESHLSHRAAADSLPLQNAFSVLFFVSVGMLFDPTIILREPLEVLATLALVIIGKYVVSVAVVLLLRYPLGMALAIGAGLAQIGEFSFILAGLGISLGLLSPEGQSLILAGAILSITINPLLFWITGEMKTRLRVALPVWSARHGKKRFEALTSELAVIQAQQEARDRQHHMKIQHIVETFPLFSSIDEASHEELLLMFRPHSASPGDRILRAGDRGDSMYFIASGSVEVQISKGEIRLGAGSFFGEMALLTGGRRTADVVAVDFCELFLLDRRDFNVFMSRHPALRAAVSEMAQARKRMNETTDETEV
ncbi:CPA2 family monovalent cation:H+ antiporter-2 [Pararhizobium capsulatum DSM 1112]|uniref:CPA2 family monovalent cation:H+ antiporter-2 n=1 Tax=Pararhizobium capsulatum DSM 1112 TaxID=1121113 RepID=A0ABU0BRZ1_9HYPH|nr:cation:proton antiporter [Pararhizobium capsulatum]MDQ0320723.1 CPA2 family monovalent cation:H+ antiporter-2 [Pararhizobium capsulatum DSM 1112]